MRELKEKPEAPAVFSSGTDCVWNADDIFVFGMICAQSLPADTFEITSIHRRPGCIVRRRLLSDISLPLSGQCRMPRPPKSMFVKC